MKLSCCGTSPYESSLIVSFLQAGGTATLQPRASRQPWNVQGNQCCVCCGGETKDYSAHIPRCLSVEWDAVGGRVY